jgi:hypothetical protein
LPNFPSGKERCCFLNRFFIQNSLILFD